MNRKDSSDLARKALTNFSSNSTVKKNEKNAKQEDDFYCGFGSWRPSRLQMCASMGFFTGVFSISGLISSTLSVYISSQITTLEKQFGFNSSISGFIISCNDIGYLVTTLLLSYLARRLHIPRALAMTTVFYGISGFVCSIPYFVTKDDLHPVQDMNVSIALTTQFRNAQLCFYGVNGSVNVSRDINGCERRSQSLIESSSTTKNMAVVLIAGGMLLQGVGKGPRTPFVTTYVDDNVDKTKTSLHLGVISGLSVFGPALAYALGGLFSRVYVTLEETDLTPRDPRWIGAWWLGFLVFGACGVLCGLPLLCFPRRLRPNPNVVVMEEELKKQNALTSVKNFSKAVYRLLTTPVFASIMVGNCITLFSISGMLAFLPKYLETQFLIPAWKANILLGALNVVASAGGSIVGGILTSRLRLHPLTCLKFIVVVTSICIGLASLGFTFGCPQPQYNKGTKESTSDTNITSLCAADCFCENTPFLPVCGEDGRNYFSPCHAGCSSVGKEGFTNCSCIISDQNTSSARSGYCETECTFLYPYAAASFAGSFVAALAFMPAVIVTLRSVQERDKPLAIGLASFLSIILGWVPGPVLFGRMVDATCLIWSSTCVGLGSCSLYDIVALRVGYHFLFVGGRTVTVLLYIFALFKAIRNKETFYMDDEISTVPEGEKLMNGETEMTVVSTDA